MKHPFLITLPLLLSGVAFAQPDPNAAGMGKNPPEAEIAQPVTLKWDTPENAARSVVSVFSSNNELYMAMAAFGARVGFYGNDEWNKVWSDTYPLTALRNLNVDNVAVDSQTDDEATVTVTVHSIFRRGGGAERAKAIQYKMQLRRTVNPTMTGFIGQKNVWRLVPLPVEEVMGKHLNGLPLYPLAATIALRDPRLLPVIQQNRGMSQLKQLGLGAMQFVQDYDEFYAFDDSARERALLPYIKNSSIFTIPGTKEEKWHFNDTLSNTAIAGVNEPARTVLFYDGSASDNEHLNFRFNDKTLICFADGHVAALARNELNDILWKP